VPRRESVTKIVPFATPFGTWDAFASMLNTLDEAISLEFQLQVCSRDIRSNHSHRLGTLAGSISAILFEISEIAEATLVSWHSSIRRRKTARFPKSQSISFSFSKITLLDNQVNGISPSGIGKQDGRDGKATLGVQFRFLVR
jgi:hypothetical protein